MRTATISETKNSLSAGGDILAAVLAERLVAAAEREGFPVLGAAS